MILHKCNNKDFELFEQEIWIDFVGKMQIASDSRMMVDDLFWFQNAFGKQRTVKYCSWEGNNFFFTLQNFEFFFARFVFAQHFA